MEINKEWISDAEWTQFCMPRTDGTRHEKMSKDEAEELLTWKYGAPPAAVNRKPQEPAGGRWLANKDLGSYFRRDEEGRIFQAPMLEDGTIERNADGTANECYVDPLEISDMEFAQVDDWVNEILGERETYLN